MDKYNYGSGAPVAQNFSLSVLLLVYRIKRSDANVQLCRLSNSILTYDGNSWWAISSLGHDV